MRIRRSDLVLAFYPNARGFAYVIFEGQSAPIDWAISDVLHAERRLDTCVRRLTTLLDRYRPDCVVLRDWKDGTARPALQSLLQALQALVESRGVQTCTVTRKDIQKVFAHLGSPTRYMIAQAIAKQIQAFAPLLPPARKIWNGEDRRMGLFDAAALVFTVLRDAEDMKESLAANGM